MGHLYLVLSHENDYTMGSGRKWICLVLVPLIYNCVQAFTRVCSQPFNSLGFFLLPSIIVIIFPRPPLLSTLLHQDSRLTRSVLEPESEQCLIWCASLHHIAGDCLCNTGLSSALAVLASGICVSFG